MSAMTEPKVTLIRGTALPVRGNDIDTDRILPARYLKEVTFVRMGEYPFYDERFDASGNPKSHPFNDARYKGASLLFVNKNFGCGSSREHAPQAILRYGIQAIVGESFGAIFTGNCVMLGTPTVMVSEEDMGGLMQSVEAAPDTAYTVDLQSKTLSYMDKKIPIDMPETHRNALMTGAWDSTSLLRSNLGKTKELASRLPYLSGFRG